MGRGTIGGRRGAESSKDSRLQSIVDKYNIRVSIIQKDKIIAENVKTETDKETVIKNKADIINYLNRKEADRKRKIENIKGLKEIEKASREQQDWRKSLERSYDGRQGTGARPKNSVEELKRKYPRAAAYLQAKEYANASNFEKWSAGKKAMEEIENGKSYKKAISKMKKWNKNGFFD